MKKLVFFLAVILVTMDTNAQELYFTRNGKVSFFSKTPLENIDGVNNEVFSLINTKKGEIAFAVLVKSFKFERALMEEHFNENYMESGKYPKSNFSGTITNLSSIKFTKDGSYSVEVEGNLTMHGIEKKIKGSGTFVISAGKIAATSKFTIALSDFNIQIPTLVADKISKTIDINVECNYTPK